MRDAENPIKAVRKSLHILERLKEREGLTLGELTDEMDLSKGAIHNHLATLEEGEFVVRRDGEYHPSLRFFEFGEYVKKRQQIYQVAPTELDALAEETDQLSSLLVEEHGRGIYIYRAYGDQALTLDTDVGTWVHLHNTALGKAILAHLPEDRVDRIIEANGLPKTGPNTITDRDTLDTELADIRDRGYAIDREERTKGVCCVAAPIIVTDGSVHGAISLAGPSSRFTGQRLESEYPDLVTDAANVISVNLTYSL